MAHLRFVFFSMIGFLAMTFLSAPSWGQGRKWKEAWWQQLEDATLDSLMEVALRQNGAVHSAWDRVEQARRQLWAQRGAYAPVIGLGGGWTRQQTPGNGGGTLGMAAHSESEPSVGSRTSAADAPLQRSRLSGTWEAQAQLNWEVDVFGRIRRLVSVQQANLQARRADYREAQVTLCAAVATTYLQLREQQQELQVLRRNACSQQAVVEMTEVRFRTGLVSKLDVAQARSVYFSTQAALPAMEASVLRSQHALAVLLGVYPDQVASVLNPVQPLPVFVAPVEVEVPMERLLLRPDVQAAQRQVEVQRAQLGVARSAWWPRLSLQAAWGGTVIGLERFGPSLLPDVEPCSNLTMDLDRWRTALEPHPSAALAVGRSAASVPDCRVDCDAGSEGCPGYLPERFTSAAGLPIARSAGKRGADLVARLV